MENGPDPKRKLVTSLINHYEPDAVVDDAYYESISKKHPNTDTLVSKLITHYEPDSEVTTEYLSGLYSKYGVTEKKNVVGASQPSPLRGIGGSSDLSVPSPLSASATPPKKTFGEGALEAVRTPEPKPRKGLEVPNKAIVGIGGVEKQKEGEWKPTQLSKEDELKFQQFATKDPNVIAWAEEFKSNYGEYPSIDNSNYDYRGAWKAGQTPTPVNVDGKTEYHWGSIGENGKELKSPDHTTRWKSDYMEITGKNPDEEGVSEASAKGAIKGANLANNVISKALNPPADIGQSFIDGQLVPNAKMRQYAQDRDFMKSFIAGERQVDIQGNTQLRDYVKKQGLALKNGADWYDNLVAGVIDAKKGAIGFADWTNDVLGELTGIPNFLEGIVGVATQKGQVGEIQKALAKTYEQVDLIENDMFEVDGQMTDLYRQGKWGEMGNLAVNTSARSAANSLLIGTGAALTGGLVAGGAAVAPIFVGGAYADQERNPKAAGVEDLSKFNRMITRPLAYGSAELTGEIISVGLLKGSTNIMMGSLRSTVKKVAETAGKEAAEQVAKEGAGTIAKNLFDVFVGNPSKEGFSEVLTFAQQKFTDKVLGINNESTQKILKDGINTWALGAASGGVTTAPQMAVTAISSANTARKKFVDYTIKNDPEGLTSLQEAIKENPEQYSTTEQDLKVREKAVNAVPDNLVEDTEVVDKVQEKQALEEQKRNLDPVFAKPIEEKIAKIDEELAKKAAEDSAKKDNKPTTEEQQFDDLVEDYDLRVSDITYGREYGELSEEEQAQVDALESEFNAKRDDIIKKYATQSDKEYLEKLNKKINSTTENLLGRIGLGDKKRERINDAEKETNYVFNKIIRKSRNRRQEQRYKEYEERQKDLTSEEIASYERVSARSKRYSISSEWEDERIKQLKDDPIKFWKERLVYQEESLAEDPTSEYQKESVKDIKDEIARLESLSEKPKTTTTTEPVINSTPTDEKYASVNNNDGKGTVDLTKQEYLDWKAKNKPVTEQLTTSKTEQNAKEQQSEQMREQGVQEQPQGESDSNMPIVNQTELQDGKAPKEEVVGAREDVESRRNKQLEIINKTNPAPNNYNTWIRKVEDIKTADEVFEVAKKEGAMYPDFTEEQMQDALDSGEITIYSSNPIENGVFVTPSKMNAQEYAGGKGGKLYSKKVKLEDIAWIDESEGQYAVVEQPQENKPTPAEPTKEAPKEPVSESELNKPFAESFGTPVEDLNDVSEGVMQTNLDGVDVLFSEVDGNTVKLESIETPEAEREQGKAKKALQKIVDKADELGKTIVLSVVPKNEKLESVEATTEALDGINTLEVNSKIGPYLPKTNTIDDARYKNSKEFSEAYHKAKKDGSNPELVKAVEELLGATTEEGLRKLYEGFGFVATEGKNMERVPNAEVKETKAEVTPETYKTESAKGIGTNKDIEFVKIGNPYIDAEIVKGEAVSGLPVSELKNKKIIQQKLKDLYDDRSLEEGTVVKELDDAIKFLESFLTQDEISEIETPKAKEETPTTIESIEKKDETDLILSGEAQKRRDDGEYERDGIVFKRNEEIKGDAGDKGVVRFAKNVEVPFTYKLVEAQSVQPSHQDGIRNPLHFIWEAQPKPRNDQGSIAAEDGFADTPRIKELGANTNAYSGAPVVNSRGEVIQGNNRAAGLRKGYNRGNQAYKNDLAKNADKFGLTEEQVLKMKNPILVRVVGATDALAIELGNYTNGDLETGSDSGINPVETARKIPATKRRAITEMLFRLDENGVIPTLNEAMRNNYEALKKLLADHLNTAQNNTIRKTSTPSPKALMELEGLIRQFLFEGGDPKISELFASLTSNQRNSIDKSLPSLFSVSPENSLISEVQNTILALSSFQSSGSESFNAWEKQSDVFNNNKTPRDVFTPTELYIAKLIAESNNTTDLRTKLTQYTEDVNGVEGGMFDDPIKPISKEDAIAKNFVKKTDSANKPGGNDAPVKKKGTSKPRASKGTTKPVSPKVDREKLKQDIKSLKEDLWNDLNSLGFAATPDKLGKEAQEFTDKLIKLAKMSIQDAGMSLEEFIKEVLSKYTGKRTDIAELSEIAYNAAKDAYIQETATEMTSTKGREETDDRFNEVHEEAFKFAEEELSGIMNELVPEDKRGVFQKERRTVKETLERGKAMIQSGAIDPAKFVQAILKTPRPLTADETAAMVYYKASLDAQIEGLTKQSNEARENGDIEGVSLAELAISEVEAQIDSYYQFQEASGYEQGLSLKMRQLLITKEYELANQVRKYKRETGKTFVPTEIMEKFKIYDEAIRELSKRINEFEKRSEESAESLEILSDPNPGEPRTKSDAAKLFAKKIRQNKFIKSAKQLSTLQSDPTGLFKFAWDSALEFIATTVEQGGTIADAVDGAIDKLKKSKWYENLSQKGKDTFNSTAKTSLSQEAMEYSGISAPSLTDGLLNIPDSFIKDLIKNGFDTIETATTEAKRFMLDNLGIDVTERQVRDAISDYGKRSKLNKDEVSQKMREMKRVGKLLSALEDVQRKKRPLRSGKERDILTQKEREIKREINALLKDIPQTSEETDSAWKSALDATKTRLRNRIEDVKKQIADGKKTPKKTSIELDAEAKYLKEEVNRLNEILRSIEGKPEMSFEQRVKITEQAIERSIQEYERRIREKDFEPLSKDPISTPEIEALRTKREQLRKQYSEEYSKSPVKDTARDSAAMKRLQKQIDELTEKIHGRISIESKKEATKEYGAHVKAMQDRVKSLRQALIETEQGNAFAEKRALENIKKATARSIQEYERRIREKDFAVKKSKQVALDAEAKALKAEQQKWKNKFDIEREKARLDERTKTEKFRERLVDIIGIPKSLVASLDFSSVLRQGGMLTARHPKMAVVAGKEMIKQTFSEAAYDKWMDEFIVSDIYNDAKKAGLYIATPNAKLMAKEESFISNIAEQIPIYGRLVKASNRAYSSYLNVMRVAIFTDFQNQIDKSGLPEKDAELAKKDMAAFINNATGRGSLLGYEPNSPELNILFFSPRFVLSRANIVMNTATGYASYSPAARKEALLTVAAYVSAVTTLILLATMAGADAEDDPRSSDFGKIKIGNLRLDPLAGLSQIVTFFSRMITGQTKSLKTKEISNLGEDNFGRNKLSVIGSFIRSKMSPMLSAIVDMADSPTGKTKTWGVPGIKEFENKVYFKNIVGEEQTLPERVMSLITPIYIQGAVKIYQEEGLAMTAAATGADIIGIGSQYHSEKTTTGSPEEKLKANKEKDLKSFSEAVNKKYPNNFVTLERVKMAVKNAERNKFKTDYALTEDPSSTIRDRHNVAIVKESKDKDFVGVFITDNGKGESFANSEDFVVGYYNKISKEGLTDEHRKILRKTKSLDYVKAIDNYFRSKKSK